MTVRGAGGTVDFTGVTLGGTPSDVEPDRAKGVAIRVEVVRGVDRSTGSPGPH